MAVDLRLVLSAVLKDYALPWNGDHGVAHWARVLEIGERLSQTAGAKVEVVRLFAVLHDSKRCNEHDDPEHGPRAAEFAETLRGSLIDLRDDDFLLLRRACWGHTHERTHPDVTIQTCWDSDRLDLGRVGITPDPYFLSTDAAKEPETLRWADGRASRRVIPALVEDTWLIDLKRARDVGPRIREH